MSNRDNLLQKICSLSCDESVNAAVANAADSSEAQNLVNMLMVPLHSSVT